MIRIIKRGSVRTKEREFSCDFCGTIFVAEESDYQTIMRNPLPGMVFGEAAARCTCPVCYHPCYVSTPYEEGLTNSYSYNTKSSLELGPLCEETEGAE